MTLGGCSWLSEGVSFRNPLGQGVSISNHRADGRSGVIFDYSLHYLQFYTFPC